MEDRDICNGDSFSADIVGTETLRQNGWLKPSILRDKNFIYCWIYPQNFPKLKTLYIDGDPCEKTIYYRFDDIDIYWIDVYYNIYKHRWAQTDERIKSISRELIENVKQKLLLDRDHCPIQ